MPCDPCTLEAEAGGLAVGGQPGLHSDILFQQNKMNKTRPNPNQPPPKQTKTTKTNNGTIKKNEPQTESNLKPGLGFRHHYQVFNRADKAAWTPPNARPGLASLRITFLLCTPEVTIILNDPWHFTSPVSSHP